MAIVGDPTDHGGMVITGSPTHNIQGRPVARLGDLVECPQYYPDGRPHGKNPIIQGSYKLMIDGQPAALHGHHSACGSTLLAGGLDPNRPIPDASKTRPPNETDDEKKNHLFGQNRPDLEKLTKEPVVRDAINNAWNQTLADGNEHGGWIFRDPNTNQLSVQMWPTGGPSSSGPTEIGAPPNAIASFHTHPTHGIDPYVIRIPSPPDILTGVQNNLSGIVTSAFGFYFYGPSSAPPIYPAGAVSGMDAATYTQGSAVTAYMQLAQTLQKRMAMDEENERKDEKDMEDMYKKSRPKVAG
jgi:uncharacterized Zn-binding protein involved in type VI secretion